MATTIPLIDFKTYGVHIQDESLVSNEDLKLLGKQIHDAFSSIGFCYIQNHGISQDLVSQMFTRSKEFFELPLECKMKYLRPKDSSKNQGYVNLGRESLNPERPSDYKEAFNYTPNEVEVWPDAEVPKMKKIFNDFFEVCKDLTHRVLDVLTIGLNFEDRTILRKSHENIGSKNKTTIRTLWYPSLPTDGSIKPGQVRCGEHSDYGTVTLLFQDGIGGLEVCNTNGDYIQATPVPGAICVNIGDLMQRWTADKLLATKHRVLIPEDELLRNKGRQSIAYFVQPDDDFVIECLDGSSKYPPISSLDYLNWRYSLTYK